MTKGAPPLKDAVPPVKKNRARLVGHHVPGGRLAHQKARVTRHAPDLLEIGRLDLEQGAHMYVASVEDHRSQGADLGRVVKQSVHRGHIRHIRGRHVNRTAHIADIAGDLSEFVLVTRGNDRLETALCETPGQRLTEPRTNARDHRDLVARHVPLP